MDLSNLTHGIFPHIHKLLPPKRLRNHDSIQPLASVKWLLQTPFATFIDDVEAFTGAPIIGDIVLHIRESHEVESFSVALNLHRYDKRPLRPNCSDCTHDYLELKRWVFMDSSATLADGKHSFTFSVRLNNNVPSSLDTPLVAFTYELRAELVLATGELMKWGKNFDVRRSLCEPGLPHDFPLSFPEPRTDACLSMKRVIHPDEISKVRLRLCVIKAQPGGGICAWELTSVKWRLEELVETKLTLCVRHIEDEGNLPNRGRQTTTHILGKGRMRSGWRSGQGEQGIFAALEFEYGPISKMALKLKTTYACDETINNTLKVSHAFVIEILLQTVTMMIDESVSSSASNRTRLIRIRRPVILTWHREDLESVEETLPAYTDIQVDPPAYVT
ncbi:hypothetical protein EDB81DRAFT_782480 [Dactylonectria macrodidyma]|uniref:LDB19 N-terminal domain-containing protein n=1 Tax=Dactylonectria macrodidyma TaxID=307937 RepID=A0A9P9FNE9_9HYPO|nr:hypothetical protein EDB81DRAFT_782480 [Dactylonectria macrodidyma]